MNDMKIAVNKMAALGKSPQEIMVEAIRLSLAAHEHQMRSEAIRRGLANRNRKIKSSQQQK